MIHQVSAQPTSINFGATGIDEILQNVRTIVTTVKGTVPLDRGFGIDISDLDLPIEISKAKMTAQIMDLVEEYEPRVEVLEVQYRQDDLEGRLVPMLTIRLREEGETI